MDLPNLETGSSKIMIQDKSFLFINSLSHVFHCSDCYGLNLKCPPQAHVSRAWSPAGGTILGDSGNFRRWDFAEGSRSLGKGP
jgi:hypothetical protein